jgi:MFS family permease
MAKVNIARPPGSGHLAPHMSQAPSDIAPSARALIKEHDYVRFWLARWSGNFGAQIQSVAMGWQMYALARQTRSVSESAFLVGMIGLSAFIPVFLLTLSAGETADRHNRRRILLICLTIQFCCSLTLGLASWRGWVSIPLLMGMAALYGASRAFYMPASASLGPMLVPRVLLPRAIAWNSLANQSAAIAGPAAAGLLVAASAAHAYWAALVLYLGAMLAVFTIRKNAQPVVNPGSRWELVKEGLRYVWRHKVIFGAISLDLFAVLLGGATALLPVFARDVLRVGAEGFGLLRAGPSIGACMVSLMLAANPIRRHAGLIMLGGVATFGAATLIFALSRAMWLSVTALAILGGADMLSVYVRQSLVQLMTPDAMRGRVSAVSSVFVGASNELGEFESGVAARFIGPIGAALFGGIGSLMVTGAWATLFPALRKADRLE